MDVDTITESFEHNEAEELQSYDFEVVHRPGRLNKNADCLSRRVAMPEPSSEEEQEQAEYVGTMTVSAVEETEEDTNYLENLQREEILRKQADDDILRTVRVWVCRGSLPDRKDIRGLHPDAQMYSQIFDTLKLDEDGILVQEIETIFGLKKRILVPEELKDAVFKLSHVHRSAGHFGVTATCARVRRNWWYPSLNQDVRTRVAICLECLAKITKEKLNAGVHIPQMSGYPMQSLFIDLVGPLPTTSKGNQYILSIQDGFSRFISLYPLKNKEAKGVVEVLVDKFIKIFGCPGRIHSDNGTEFVNNIMRGMQKRLEICHTRGPPYNPQSNQVERFHRTLASMLRVALPREDIDWDLHLSAITLAYNTKVNASTGVTPSLAFLGREAKLPVDLILKTPDQMYETVDNCVKHMIDRYNQIFAYYTKKQEGCIRRNAKRYIGMNKFEIGDEVWYLSSRRVPGKPTKLTDHWTGPWQVEERVAEALYRIRPKNPNSKHKSMVANVSRLKKIIQTTTKDQIPHNLSFDREEDDSEAEELCSDTSHDKASHALQVPIYTPIHTPMIRDMTAQPPRQADRVEEGVNAPPQPQDVQDAIIPPQQQDTPSVPMEEDGVAETEREKGKEERTATSAENVAEGMDKRGSETITPNNGAKVATSSINEELNNRRGSLPMETDNKGGSGVKRGREETPSPPSPSGSRHKRRSFHEGGPSKWDKFKSNRADYEAAAREDTSSDEDMPLNTICIPIKRGAQAPYRATPNSAGYDFYAPNAVVLAPHTVTAVDLGLCMALPGHVYLQLKSRSGLAKKGINLIAGVVDPDYRGSIKALLINYNDTPFKINQGQRICQGIILRYEQATFQEVSDIGSTVRGTGGFGHTD